MKPGKRDDERFKELYLTWRDCMMQMAHTFFSDQADCEDQVQEALYRIMCRMDLVQDVHSQRTKNLCLIVLKNRCLNELEKRKREEPVDFQDSDQAFHYRSGRDDYKAFEKTDAITRELEKLNPEIRDVLVLNIIYGYSAAEIAGMLEKKTAAVSKMLQRAKKRLYGALKGDFDEA
ncbi:MAG: sigma-70 family RNA polymerase sigma factor [Lachnospiraceae bacterium]|nr:sigma-70 family RNA polymerase sigma factor [Lachnospiraceae bacterium]